MVADPDPVVGPVPEPVVVEGGRETGAVGPDPVVVDGARVTGAVVSEPVVVEGALVDGGVEATVDTATVDAGVELIGEED